ncbi:hypothetical protein PV325_009836 [Microctonus aethiopoides]|nr:hypothetical protein PV325_009836 [Microctonus aethiopoides]
MRVDGKLKLMYKAVPTLFNNLIQENDANNEADEEINDSESSDESDEDELSLKNVRKLIKSDQETYDKQSFEKLFKALEKSESLRKIQKKKF